MSPGWILMPAGTLSLTMSATVWFFQGSHFQLADTAAVAGDKKNRVLVNVAALSGANDHKAPLGIHGQHWIFPAVLGKRGTVFSLFLLAIGQFGSLLRTLLGGNFRCSLDLVDFFLKLLVGVFRGFHPGLDFFNTGNTEFT
ncbi:MAG: hypothetical protein ACLSUW_03110 [Akkermansia sp.]